MNQKIVRRIESIFFFVFGIGGGILAGISIAKFRNYRHPYLFGFILTVIAVVIGFYILKKIKSHAKALKFQNSIGILTYSGLIGCCMFLGYHLNQSLSKLIKCDRFTIVSKEFHPQGSKSSEINTLVINIDGENERLICSNGYWRRMSVGDEVNVCIYSGLLGFDNLVLMYDK